MKKRPALLLFLLFLASGIFAQWTTDPKVNTLINDTTGDQVIPKLAINQQTGMGFISWFSAIEGFQYDVYMNLFNKDGQLNWGAESLLVSDNPTMSWVTDYGLMMDDENCAILTTQDIRTGSSNVFAYRIGPYGDFLWGYEGKQLTDNTNFNPSPNVIQDHSGNYIIGWSEDYYIFTPSDTTEKSYIRFLKLNKEGNFLWDSAMVLQNDSIKYLFLNFNFVLKEDNGFYLTFIGIYETDTLFPGHYPYMNIYVQSFDSNGIALWDHPVALEADFHLSEDFYIYGDSYYHQDGGIVIGWQSADPNALVKMQHLESDGTKLCDQWGTIISTNPGHMQEDFVTTYDHDNDYLLVFCQDLYYDPVGLTYCSAILGQKFDSHGVRLWGDTGTLMTSYICAPDTAMWPCGAAMHPDYGAACTYTIQYLTINGPDTVINNYIYAFRTNEFGGSVWEQGSIVVSDVISSKVYWAMSEYTNGEWIAAWSDGRKDPGNDFAGGIYAQNIIEDGTLGPLFIYNPNAGYDIDLKVIPNPLKTETTVSFYLEETQNISLTLYGETGELIRELASETFINGLNTVSLRDLNLSAGIYYLVLSTGNSVITEKLVVL